MLEVKNQRGMTLVEVMVGMVISLILLNGVIQIFISTKQTHRFNEEVSRIQESGRIAMEILTRDMRMAGFQGCADLSSIPANIIAVNPPTTAFNSEALHGWEISVAGIATPATPVIPALGANVVPNSDVFAIKNASDQGIQLTGNMNSVDANIQVLSNTANFQASDVLFISDCQTVDVFRATTAANSAGIQTIVHSAPQNTANFLSKPYGTDARVYAFVSNTYFVGNTTRTNNRGNPIFALYRRDINGAISEIVEGVENIQILYGERADNGNMRYVAANNGTLDPTKIISVRFALLMHSVNAVNNTDDTTTYNVAGTNIGPVGGGTTVTHNADRRLRRVFVSTVKLRNRR